MYLNFDIAELDRGEPRLVLVRDSRVDHQTQILNRFGFLQRMEDVVPTYKNGISVMMVDVDNFKKFNDKFGHAEGDLVLQNVAKTLSENLRGDDLVKPVLGRYGGEEFIVSLPYISITDLKKVGHRLRREVKRKCTTDRYSVTISIGTTFSTPTKWDFQTLAQRADKALYMAKEAGRDKVRCCLN